MIKKKDKNIQKQIAEESIQTRKTREKIKKKNEEFERKITKDALKKQSVEIHKWIVKNAGERVVLYEKEIALFDENQNAAKESRRVKGMAEQLQKELESTGKEALQTLLANVEKEQAESVLK